MPPRSFEKSTAARGRLLERSGVAVINVLVGLAAPRTTVAEVSVEVPLCVDFDGTLINTALLHEMSMPALRTRPRLLLRAPLLVHGGGTECRGPIFT